MPQALTKLLDAASHAEGLVGAGTSAGVYIVGLGIREFAEAPLENLLIISQADKLFFLVHDKEAVRLLRRLSLWSEDLYRFYVSGKAQSQVYEDIADYVISNYENNRVVFATYGNPFFLNNISTMIYNEAKKLGIPVYAYIAPSSIDAIVTILLMDVQGHGFQCYMASHLLRKYPQIDTSVPLLIFQLGSLGEQKITLEGRLSTKDINGLKTFLQEMYCNEDLWAFVSCSPSFCGEHKVVVDKLKNLHLIAPIARNGTLVLGTNIISKVFRA